MLIIILLRECDTLAEARRTCFLHSKNGRRY